MGIVSDLMSSGYRLSVNDITDSGYELKLYKMIDDVEHSKAAVVQSDDALFIVLSLLKQEFDNDIRNFNDK